MKTKKATKKKNKFVSIPLTGTKMTITYDCGTAACKPSRTKKGKDAKS